MGDITKKRKRNGAEVAVDAAAVSKKSKKAKNPPKVAEPEDNDSDSQDNEDASEDRDEPSAEEDSDNEDDAGEEQASDDDDADNTVGDLPTDAAPILPTVSTESELFDQLKLSEKTMKAITEMGFTKMTAIQRTVRDGTSQHMNAPSC